MTNHPETIEERVERLERWQASVTLLLEDVRGMQRGLQTQINVLGAVVASFDRKAGESTDPLCPLCQHRWAIHDPEDGRCDDGDGCFCGRELSFMRQALARLAREARA